jgi:MoaA/NifB/PqqE/SkfB family radical SAM enzyme
MNVNAPPEAYPGVRDVRLGIEVTTECNIRCPHCFARSGISRDASLPTERVKEIARDGHEIGYRLLHLTGGEPLLWKGLFEVLDHAFGLGYETVLVNTNGTLLTQETSRRLATYPNLSISISLEGTEALHDRVRGEGSYVRTVRGLENALDAGLDPILFTAACKSLLPDLPPIVEGLYKAYPGIRYLTLIQLTRPADGAFPMSHELLAPDDYLQLVRTVALLNLYGLRTNVLNDPLVNAASSLLEMPWIPRAHPLYRQGSIMVMATRDIRLAHSGRERFGKYESGMVERVLASEAYQRAVSPDIDTCPSCRHSARCAENGSVRPSEGNRDLNPERYCVRVLDAITA